MSSTNKELETASLPLRFLLAGTSGVMAVCFTHPMDVLKNRMQMSGEGSRVREHKTVIHLFESLIRKEGYFAAYRGLTAAWLRQATFATVRLGIYTTLFEQMSTTTPDGKIKPPAFHFKVVIAATSAVAGAIVGTPAEVCLVRMAVDGRLPPEIRRNYRNVFHALYRVVIDDGPKGLFRGLWPTVIRSVVTTVAQLVTYSQMKEFLLSTSYFKDNAITHFTSGMVSGVVTAVAALPADIVKARIQNMRFVSGKREYHSATEIITRIVRNEGFFALWKGFTPFYLRTGPHTVLSLLFLEKLTGLYAQHFLGKERIGGL